jgi:ribosomal protein L37AE/L43A
MDFDAFFIDNLHVITAVTLLFGAVVWLRFTGLPLLASQLPEASMPRWLIDIRDEDEARRRSRAPVKQQRYEATRGWHNDRVYEAEPVEDDRCAACDGHDVAHVEDGVYRCNACGHEGGTNYPAWFARKKQEKALEQSPEERRAAARGTLGDVALALTALEGNIAHALSMSRLDINRVLDDTVLDDHGEAQKLQELYAIQGEVGRINGEVRHAGVLLERDLSHLELAVDTNFMLAEDRNRWTKLESEYVYQHERAVHEHLEELAHGVAVLKLELAKARKELSGPPRRRPV